MNKKNSKYDPANTHTNLITFPDKPSLKCLKL